MYGGIVICALLSSNLQIDIPQISVSLAPEFFLKNLLFQLGLDFQLHEELSVRLHLSPLVSLWQPGYPLCYMSRLEALPQALLFLSSFNVV